MRCQVCGRKLKKDGNICKTCYEELKKKKELKADNEIEVFRVNRKYSPKFNQALIKNGFESVLVCRIQKDDMIKGYLVWAVRRSLRIWQENECALIFYLAELLAEE